MGILTTNVNETGRAILEIESFVLNNYNSIVFSVAQLETQKYAMESNSEFTQEDIDEISNLILNIKNKLKEI